MTHLSRVEENGGEVFLQVILGVGMLRHLSVLLMIVLSTAACTSYNHILKDKEGSIYLVANSLYGGANVPRVLKCVEKPGHLKCKELLVEETLSDPK